MYGKKKFPICSVAPIIIRINVIFTAIYMRNIICGQLIMNKQDYVYYNIKYTSFKIKKNVSYDKPPNISLNFIDIFLN